MNEIFSLEGRYYSVALFFFISGCSESTNREMGIWYYVRKKVRTIIIPWFLFSLASVGGIIKNNSYEGVKEQLFYILKGCIRNSFWAPALWFLTCLFGVCVFSVLRKIRVKALVIGICLSLYLLAEYILQDIKVFQKIGECTLFLCGSEFILKNAVDDFIYLLGLNTEFVTPLSVYVYTFVLLVIGVQLIVPVEKAVFKRVHIL